MAMRTWYRDKWIHPILLIASILLIVGCAKLEKAEVLHMDNYMDSYANPFPSLEQEWDDYGNGDPFVMRYNGQYYLYVSTKDHRVGIKAWRSNDLIDWSYIGLVADDAESTGAYAPEVVYWNGKFYLYTSPAGNGHYVYESQSPEGPFQRVTDNVGMSIDGSVFIDDDGRWYFTHAGTSGIVGVTMPSPTEFDNGQVIEGAYLGHWTEGSMIIKRNGLYYMTLTGNHVFSKGYRIHYAVAEQSPLGPYVMPQHNPIAIHTEGDFYSLGHSSTVLGPDMDSYYLVYHNLLGRSSEGPPVRAMNIDRLVFNGSKMDLLGPTSFKQPVPRMPELAAHLNEGIDEQLWRSRQHEQGGIIVSSASTAAAFTVEYNFSIEQSDEQGALEFMFNVQDDEHYDAVVLLPNERKLTVASIRGGIATELAASELLPDMDLAALHTVRVVQHEHGLDVYWDSLQQLSLNAAGNIVNDRATASSNATVEAAAAEVPVAVNAEAVDNAVAVDVASEATGGAIGYRYDRLTATLYYTAFANAAAGSSDYDVLKPIPGTVEAVHYLQGEKSGYFVAEKSEQAPIRAADGVHIEETDAGDYAVQLENNKDWLRYGVNVAETGDYVVAMMVDSRLGDAELELIVDDEHATRYKLQMQELTADASLDSSNSESWRKVRLGTLKLDQGYHTITVRAVKGKLLWSNMSFAAVDASSYSFEHLLEDSTAESMHGQWQINDGWHSGLNDQQDAKLYGGEANWSDYRVETKLRLGDDASGNAGVMLRVTNESDFPHQVTDALIGYYVAVTPTKLELYKLNYDSVMLHAEKMKLPRNEEIALTVEAVAETITVYVNDSEVFSYTDANPLLVGKLGLRSQLAKDIELTDLSVTSIAAKD